MNKSDLVYRMFASRATFLEAEATEKSGYSFAKEMAVRMWEKHFKEDAPEWVPADDLMGVLTQISNMLTGLDRVKS